MKLKTGKGIDRIHVKDEKKGSVLICHSNQEEIIIVVAVIVNVIAIVVVTVVVTGCFSSVFIIGWCFLVVIIAVIANFIALLFYCYCFCCCYLSFSPLLPLLSL